MTRNACPSALAQSLRQEMAREESRWAQQQRLRDEAQAKQLAQQLAQLEERLELQQRRRTEEELCRVRAQMGAEAAQEAAELRGRLQQERSLAEAAQAAAERERSAARAKQQLAAEAAQQAREQQQAAANAQLQQMQVSGHAGAVRSFRCARPLRAPTAAAAPGHNPRAWRVLAEAAKPRRSLRLTSHARMLARPASTCLMRRPRWRRCRPRN